MTVATHLQENLNTYGSIKTPLRNGTPPKPSTSIENSSASTISSTNSSPYTKSPYQTTPKRKMSRKGSNVGFISLDLDEENTKPRECRRLSLREKQELYKIRPDLELGTSHTNQTAMEEQNNHRQRVFYFITLLRGTCVMILIFINLIYLANVLLVIITILLISLVLLMIISMRWEFDDQGNPDSMRAIGRNYVELHKITSRIEMAPTPFQVGNKIPKMIGTTQMGMIKLHDYVDGAWTLLLTFPQNFHPVWMTELGMLTKLKPQFDERNCRVLGLSIGSLKEQARFLDDVNETQDVQVNFPIFADESGELSRILGLISTSVPSNGAEHYKLPYSAAIILDIDMIARFVFYYPISIGRNLYEFIRVLDGLQVSAYNQVVLPTNWKVNDDVFIEPDISSDAAKALFPHGFHEIKPYFRVTPSPSILEED